MKWDAETRYKLLLEIHKAVASKKNQQDLFNAISRELHKHFNYDRLAIILYNHEDNSIEYFASADGVQPGGEVSLQSRPIEKGDIARIVISSGRPTILDDLTQYSNMNSIKKLVEAGLTSTLTFPMIVREKILGSIHFSYIKKPYAIHELADVLGVVSELISIAVDNMISYTSLQKTNNHLKNEKDFLLKNNDDYHAEGFFFKSKSMRDVVKMIEKAASTDETILLTGETGTGKDFLAHLIHQKSPRRDHLFVKTNCPGLTTSLFESELFGHAKGAFTGAEKQRLGRFELANKGTIFLDEIGELPLNLQAKLLQVLQEKRFERVGESSSIPMNARVIAATNVDLMERVKSGKFRQDLFYRLDTVTIRVPALRERPEDIPLLVHNITKIEADLMHKKPSIYSDEVLHIFSRYQWPGNIRELKNMIKRILILNNDKVINIKVMKELFPMFFSLKKEKIDFYSLKNAEKKHIIKALNSTKGIIGGKNGAANLLDIPRSTLQYRLKKLNIDINDYRS
ncbi:MAG: Fis family transcriptional regulator [Desulfobulbus propionicus]|nr:MAG: Fis family transcriptional regulator [Desulfobulbus propionicus]